jgi:hypothetical protein
MNTETQYCQNGNSFQVQQKNQHSLIQNLSIYFVDLNKLFLGFYGMTKIHNSQYNMKEEKQGLGM